MLRVLRLLGRLFLWFNYMFPRSGSAIASGRQYRGRNLFLEIFGAVRLLIALLIIYFGVINPIFSFKQLNNTPYLEKPVPRITENIYGNHELLKKSEEISSQEAEINKSETLEQYEYIHSQIF